ncbi:hypothetical protein D3C87_2062030 [compost metagenome]
MCVWFVIDGGGGKTFDFRFWAPKILSRKFGAVSFIFPSCSLNFQQKFVFQGNLQEMYQDDLVLRSDSCLLN